MRRATLALCAALLSGCPTDGDTLVEAEPLDLPADPAAWGGPVGVSTFDQDGTAIEVWYPAPSSAAGAATEVMEMWQFIPEVVLDTLGGFSLPEVDTRAIRDAPLRAPEAPYPVVVFSHGFGGFRLQSVDFATHLASRGYVVVAADHPGRSLGAVLPCLVQRRIHSAHDNAYACDYVCDYASSALASSIEWLMIPHVLIRISCRFEQQFRCDDTLHVHIHCV